MKSFAPKSSRGRASRRHLSRGLTLAFVLVAALAAEQVGRVVLAINLSTVNTPVTQNFDTMTPNSATAALPADFKADRDQAVRTVGTYAGAVTATTQTASQPTATAANGIYNFGSGANNTGTDRAVGFISAGTAGSTQSGNLYAKYTNTTGAPLSALRISYDVEKYRNGSNPSGYRFQLFYSTNGTTWTSAGANFLTSFAANADNSSCTPSPCSTTPVSNQPLSIPTIANNSDIYLAWNYSVSSGTTTTNAQGLAIDNISVTPLGSSISANGVRTTDIQGTDDAGFAMVLQPDGKIVVGGYAVDSVNGDKEFALVRYNYDGSLDTTFGGTGKVVTDFNGTSDRIWGLALQTDGKIVAAGETVSVAFPGTNDIAIARYTTAGVLDTTFGGTGKVTTDHGGGASNAAYGVAMSGTNIIVAGYELVSGNNDFMAARYTTAGVLDATFGTLGVTTVGFGGFNDVARGVAIDSSSRIVLGGYSNSGSNDDFAVTRLTTAGALDTTFVSPLGKAAIDLGNNDADQAFALTIDSSQRIILAGSTYNPGTGNKDFALVRYLSTGALDTGGFGAGGIVKTDFNNSPDVAQGVYVRADGFITAAGFSRYSITSDDFALARYTANGALDSTFNTTGKLTTSVSNADDRLYAVAEEFDGKIVAAGFAAVAGSNPVSRNFALARFNSNGTLDSTNATPLNGPDLLLTKTGPTDPNSVIAGQPYSYTITVTNRGNGMATNVVITDTLPAGISYVSHVASNGSSMESGGTVTNNVGVLNAGATATLTINVLAGNTPQLIANTATATLTETDATPGNNTATEFTRIIGLTDLSFSPSTVIGGCQNSTGTVTLSGEAPAGGATVTISSADPAAATAPPTVVVPQGQSSASFQVTTFSVVSNKQVRFQADLGPTTFVRRINVNAGACN